MKHKKALLIIDMQKGSFTSETPRLDTEGVIYRINSLARVFRTSGCPVIFIQHDGTGTNEFIPGTVDWELLDDLTVTSTDIFIDKYANDAFYNTKLKSKLDEMRVNELFITGCATDFCVESTIQSALIKDYNITVVADGHTTGERPFRTAEKVVEHYNWVWQNLAPTGGKIMVKSFEQLKTEHTHNISL
ncbi:cysteine hydrolase [Sinomicrobium kalidii]|uniref:cysteine hydrolase family protein n=1 Tax=Sinomicrobium kalidii TaxID=2900738 RepID=UPI001E40786E|nr:cysteine hydrolase family protein [Sinomicrobium kalidii]UGU16435.1 cysteine hydrolase [Sinomicrobium kalidii]